MSFRDKVGHTPPTSTRDTASPRMRDLLLRLLDFWRPPGPFKPNDVFRYRCLAGGFLVGLLVALASLALALVAASALGAALSAGFATLVVVLLLAARLGAPFPWVGWAALVLIGVFAALFALGSDRIRLDQLVWLVMLPLVGRVLFDRVGGEPPHRRFGPTGLVGGGALAVALGVAALVAQSRGLHFHLAPRPLPVAAAVTELAMFVSSVVGLLALRDLAVQALEDELALLRRLLTVCAWCQDVREDDGTWITPDAFIHRHGQGPLTHGICPSCSARHWPPQ